MIMSCYGGAQARKPRKQALVVVMACSIIKLSLASVTLTAAHWRIVLRRLISGGARRRRQRSSPSILIDKAMLNHHRQRLSA